jgi:hypothetical protein
MVVCVSPASTDVEETKHVLKFGCLAQTVTTVSSTPAPKMGVCVCVCVCVCVFACMCVCVYWCL